MTNQENVNPAPQGGDEYRAGQRSITQRRGKSRFEMVREKKARGSQGRPFIIMGLVILAGLVAFLAYGFVREFVMPPRALAIQVGDVKYTRGDVVDLIRFNQRLSEELGIPFNLGNSVFDVLQVIQEAELSYQVAPNYGISVDPEEVDERVEFILGFGSATEADEDSPEYQANLAEAKRQFLNRVSLPEDVWRDFLTKVLFQERLREYVQTNEVSRIQPQVHAYEIRLDSNNAQLLAQIERELKAGRPIEEVVREFSSDPEARRTGGDVGWIPQGMLAGQYDRLLFGTLENGERVLPFKTPSTPIFDSENSQYIVIVAAEHQEARELSPEALEALTDRAFTTFMNERRREVDLYLDLDSDIANWVNEQVKLNAIAPTPGAGTQDPLQGLLPPGASLSNNATPVPTPNGIPGLNLPVD